MESDLSSDSVDGSSADPAPSAPAAGKKPPPPPPRRRVRELKQQDSFLPGSSGKVMRPAPRTSEPPTPPPLPPGTVIPAKFANKSNAPTPPPLPGGIGISAIGRASTAPLPPPLPGKGGAPLPPPLPGGAPRPPPPPGAPSMPNLNAAPAMPVPTAMRGSIRLKPLVRPSRKMRPLFWSRIGHTAALGTLWSEIVEADKMNVPMLESVFGTSEAKVKVGGGEGKAAMAAALGAIGAGAKAAGSGGGAGGKLATARSPKSVTKLIDGKRAQNVTIALSRLRLSYESIRDAIVRVDPVVLGVDFAEKLLTVVPNEEEKEVLLAFRGDKEALGPTEQFFLALAPVPRIRQRLDAHLFVHNFPQELSALEENCVHMEMAVQALSSSADFLKVLGRVLHIGNHMNGSTKRGQAEGFQLDILPKLKNVKGAVPESSSESTNSANAVRDGGTIMTVVDFLVDDLERHSPGTMLWHRELRPCKHIVNMDLEQTRRDVNALEGGLNRLRNEVERGAGSVDHPDHFAQPFRERMRPKLAELSASFAQVESRWQHAVDTALSLATKFGEKLKGSQDMGGLAKFFECISIFADDFAKAVEKKARIVEEKHRRRLREQSAKMMRMMRGGGRKKDGAKGEAKAQPRAPRTPRQPGTPQAKPTSPTFTPADQLKSKLRRRMNDMRKRSTSGEVLQLVASAKETAPAKDG